MHLLKRKYWWIHLILMIVTFGLYFFVLAHYLNLYQEESWYEDYRYWLVAVLLFFFPVLLLVVIFLVQMACTVASKLNVPGKEIYGLPYAWILCLILPIVGWSLLIVMGIYIAIWSIVMLEKGEGERFLTEN